MAVPPAFPLIIPIIVIIYYYNNNNSKNEEEKATRVRPSRRPTEKGKREGGHEGRSIALPRV